MKIYLAIVLDKEGKIRKDLYEADSLLELDNYLCKYHNSKEIRDDYRNEIDEFLKDNQRYLRYLEEKAIAYGQKPRNNRGRISICFYGKGEKIRFIPMIFQNEKLMNINDCFKQIRVSLDDDMRLQKLVDEKKYLLTQNEIDTIKRYFKWNNQKYKRDFLDDFTYRVRRMEPVKRYYYLRSLINLCSLKKENEIKTKKGDIKHIDIPLDRVKLVRERIVDTCADDFL